MAAAVLLTQMGQVHAKEESVQFESHFVDRALRLEMIQVGNARKFTTTLQSLVEESCWPENPDHLITPFPYGKFVVRVHDEVSGQLLFTRGFDSLFAEYSTTKPALAGVSQSYQTTIRIPMPKASVNISIDHRLPDNSYSTILNERLEPNDARISKQTITEQDEVVEIQSNGPAHECVDLVFLSEGYTSSQKDKFQKDAARMTESLFLMEPYRRNRNRFNVKGVFRPSEEPGTDNPNKGEFRDTALQSSFNTLGIDRYLLLEENHRMHQMASLVPYDTIVVLVNTTTYGGGSICMDFCVCSADSFLSEMVFVHELGHGLAYLADEYVGNVSYNDIYPENVEPVEPNITRQLDPSVMKWKARLTAGVPLPTPIQPNVSNSSIVGAFEGGGYLSKGMYRSQQNCLMGSANPNDRFCAACEDAISEMIDYYSKKPTE